MVVGANTFDKMDAAAGTEQLCDIWEPEPDEQVESNEVDLEVLEIGI